MRLSSKNKLNRIDAVEAAEASYKKSSYQESIAYYDEALEVHPNCSRAHNGKGNALMQMGNYQEALACFESALKVDPKKITALIGKGFALINLNQLEAAEECFDLVSKWEAKNLNALLGKGDIYYKKEQLVRAQKYYDDAYQACVNEFTTIRQANLLRKLNKHEAALSYYEKTLRFKPTSAEAFLGKGKVFYLQKKFEAALDCFEKVIKFKFNPSAEDLIHKGDALLGLNRLEEALRIYQEALNYLNTKKPNESKAETKKIDEYKKIEEFNNKSSKTQQFKEQSLRIHLKIADLFLKLKNLTKAHEFYDLTLEINPQEIPANLGKCQILYQLGKWDEALIIYEQIVLKLDPTNALALQGKDMIDHLTAKCKKGDDLFQQKEYESALEFYDTVLGENANSVMANTGKGNFFNTEEAYYEAIEHFEKALSVDAKYIPAHLGKAYALTKINDIEGALLCYDDAININFNLTDAHYGKADIFYTNNHFQAALNSYVITIDLDEKHTAAYLGKGNVLYHFGGYLGALNCYDIAAKLNPEDIIPLLKKANTLLKLERHEAALECYETIIKLDSKCVEAYEQKAKILSDKGKDAAAILNSAHELSKISPTLPNLLKLAKIFSNRKLYAPALTTYEAILKEKPSCLEANFERGKILYEQKSYIEALKSFDFILEETPKSLDANYYKANSLYCLEKYDEAAQIYDTILKHDVTHIHSYCGKANVFYTQKKYNKALQSYNDCLTIDPNYLPALRGKGTTCWRFGQTEFKEALYCFDKVLADNSSDLTVLICKGIVLFLQKRNKEALSNFENAIKIDSESIEAKNGLANALLCDDQCSQAVDYFKSVIDSYPSQELLNEFLFIQKLNPLYLLPDQGLEQATRRAQIQEEIFYRIQEEDARLRQEERIKREIFASELKPLKAVKVETLTDPEAQVINKKYQLLEEKAQQLYHVEFYTTRADFYQLSAHRATDFLRKEVLYELALKDYKQAMQFAPFENSIALKVKTLTEQLKAASLERASSKPTQFSLRNS